MRLDRAATSHPHGLHERYPRAGSADLDQATEQSVRRRPRASDWIQGRWTLCRLEHGWPGSRRPSRTV